MTSGTSDGGELGRLVAVRRLTDHLDVVLGADQHDEPAPEQLLVVDHHDPDRLVRGAEAASAP